MKSLNKIFIKFLFAIIVFFPMLNAASITVMLYSREFGEPFAGQGIAGLGKFLLLTLSIAILYTYGICKVLFAAVDRAQE